MKRFVVASLLLCAVSAFGQTMATGPNGMAPGVQELETRIGPRTYGPATIAYLTSALGFQGWDTGTTFDWSGGRYITGGVNEFVASIELPEGALVSAIELEACDTSATAQISAYITACASPAGLPCTHPGAPATTGIAFAGGCNFFSTSFTPFTINNVNNSYFFEIIDPVDGTTTRISSVRLYYKLQVSPDPTTATFTDVPVGHPYHRFVEALAASGITGGCGGGNYCPDSPITRGQMAVFLAGALGLHWAP